MNKLILIVLSLSIFLATFFIISPPILADNLPKGVIPEQVTAVSGIIIPGAGAKYQSILTFWNVGQMHDNSSYHEAKTQSKCLVAPSGCPPEVTWTGTFSGGPNGTFSINGAEFSLTNGTKAVFAGNGVEVVYTVENPEAFSKYDWSENASVKSPPVTYDEKSTFANPWDETFPPDNDIEETAAVISKIYGDVEFADPAHKNNIIRESVTAMKIFLNDAIFGRVRKAHFEGDRIVEESNFDISSKWNLPFKGLQLSEGYKMKTGDGRAVLEFKDGTKFILRENSQITFDKNGISLDNGKYYFLFRKLGKKIYIYSKTAKSTITGTKFEVTVNSDGTLLKVYEGSVVTGSLVSKQISKVNAGEEITATDKGLDKAKALSGEKDVDMNALELEIVNKDFAGTKKLGMYIFIFIIISILVLVLSIGLIFRRKRLKK